MTKVHEKNRSFPKSRRVMCPPPLTVGSGRRVFILIQRKPGIYTNQMKYIQFFHREFGFQSQSESSSKKTWSWFKEILKLFQRKYGNSLRRMLSKECSKQT